MKDKPDNSKSTQPGSMPGESQGATVKRGRLFWRWSYRLWMVAVYGLLVCLLAYVFIGPSIVRYYLVQALATSGFTNSAVEVDSVSLWGVRLSNVDAQGRRLTIGSITVKYNAGLLTRSQVDTINMTGVQWQVLVREGKIDWGLPAFPETGEPAGPIPFRQLNLRASFATMDVEGWPIRIPVTGQLVRASDEVLDVDFLIEPFNLPMKVTGTINVQSGELDLQADLNLVNPSDGNTPKGRLADLFRDSSLTMTWHTPGSGSARRDSTFTVSANLPRLPLTLPDDVATLTGLVFKVDGSVNENYQSLTSTLNMTISEASVLGSRIEQLNLAGQLQAEMDEQQVRLSLKPDQSRMTWSKATVPGWLSGSTEAWQVGPEVLAIGNEGARAVLNRNDWTLDALDIPVEYRQPIKAETKDLAVTFGAGAMRLKYDAASSWHISLTSDAAGELTYGESDRVTWPALGFEARVDPFADQFALAGGFNVSGAAWKNKLYDTGAEGIDLQLPIRFGQLNSSDKAEAESATQEKKPALPTGQVKIANLYRGRLEAKEIQGSISFDQDALSWDAKGSWLEGLPVKTFGRVALVANGLKGKGHFVANDLLITDPKLLASRVPELTGLEIDGDFDLAMDLTFAGDEVVPSGIIEIKNAGFRSQDAKVGLETIEGSVELASIWPTRTNANQNLKVGKVVYGPLTLLDGTVRFRIDNYDRVTIERTRFRWEEGGDLTVYGFEFDPSNPRIALELHAEKFNLLRLVELLTDERIGGEVMMNGRIELIYFTDRKKPLRIESGYFYTKPGQTGRLMVNDAWMLNYVAESVRPSLARLPNVNDVLSELKRELKQTNISMLIIDLERTDLEDLNAIVSLRESEEKMQPGKADERKTSASVKIGSLQVIFRNVESALNQAIERGLELSKADRVDRLLEILFE